MKNVAVSFADRFDVEHESFLNWVTVNNQPALLCGVEVWQRIIYRVRAAQWMDWEKVGGWVVEYMGENIAAATIKSEFDKVLRFDAEYIGADPLDLTEDRGAIFIFHTPTLEETAQIMGMTVIDARRKIWEMLAKLSA